MSNGLVRVCFCHSTASPLHLATLPGVVFHSNLKTKKIHTSYYSTLNIVVPNGGCIRDPFTASPGVRSALLIPIMPVLENPSCILGMLQLTNQGFQ